MRTTLDIDEDVLMAVKELARSGQESTGKTISRLVRQALSSHHHGSAPDTTVIRGGFRPFGRRGGAAVTNDEINRLRDIEGV
ncbi:MAG: hypothetical protein Q4E06_05435 [Lautropia sp.]|nr:hypothetical protein [Lautropia sp.]